MQRLSGKTRSSMSESVNVEAKVPKGYARTSYEIEGFNTAYNRLACGPNGRRIHQTRLPIVFASDTTRDIPDGVTVEALLSVCSDHLEGEFNTPDSGEASARASALIRRAIKELTH